MNLDINDQNYFDTSDQTQEQQAREEILFKSLAKVLLGAGYSPSTNNYSINDLSCEDKLVITKDGLLWAVFHLERSRRHWPAFFSNVDDAIRFFIMKVTNNDQIKIEQLIHPAIKH
jgi:hypothetical protein